MESKNIVVTALIAFFAVMLFGAGLLFGFVMGRGQQQPHPVVVMPPALSAQAWEDLTFRDPYFRPVPTPRPPSPGQAFPGSFWETFDPPLQAEPIGPPLELAPKKRPGE